MFRLVAVLCALALVHCAPPSEPDLVITADRTVFDGRSQRALIQVEAFDASGAPGTGTVSLTAGSGVLVEGAQVALIGGKGSVTFRCDPREDPACAGNVRIGATWRTVNRSLTVKVTPSDPTARPRWSVVPTLQPVTLNAAALAPDGTVWAVGERGVVMPFSRGQWGAPVPTGTTSTLRAIAISADGTIDVCGDYSALLTGTAAGLSPLPVPGTLTGLTAVARFKGSLFVGYADGSVSRYGDMEGRHLVNVPIASLSEDGRRLVAVGGDAMFSFDGSEWSPLATPVPATWRKARLDPDGLWVLGLRNPPSSAPILVQGPGPDWRSATLPAGDVRDMAWGLGSSERFVVTDSTVFRKQDGVGWEDLEAPSGGNAIVSLGGLSVLVVGPPGVSLVRVR